MGSYSLIFLILGANIIFCYGTLSNYHNVTVDAVTQCDEGWYYSLDLNQCYYISSELSSFNDAENKCNALSSHLVSVLSQEEYVVVSTQIQNQNFAGVNPAWIGLQSTSSADLYWTDSYSVNYTHWINTTDYPGGYCFAWFSTPANNGWWYQPCGQPLPFICKRHSYMNYVNITTNSGTITSPNYPQPFDADGNTIYFITVDPGYVIDLTFNFIAIDTYSLVNVYDGPNVTAPLLETIKKGYRRNMIESTSNKVTLQFVASHQSAGVYIGWSADFSSTVPVATSGGFTSPNFPAFYDNNENVNYTIIVPDNLGIFITFWDFSSETNCDYLYLTSSCGSTSWNSGYNNVPFTYNLSCSYAYFNWRTDDSQTYQGFNLTWVAGVL